LDPIDPIARCAIDPAIDRVIMGDVAFPLGVYPVEAFEPVLGYAVDFESADLDNGSDDELDQWPDRYVYDIVVPATRLRTVCYQLITMMPGRIFPILDYMGHDAFREIDPYIAYEPIGQDRFLDAFRRYQPFLLEDGMCGFGAMSESPFMYFFVDEHKVITVRVETAIKERVDRVLEALEIAQTAEPAGADAAAHEHRTALATPDDRPDLLSSDEAVEWLREEWRLTLNVDPEINLDDGGRELGFTPFRCLVRWMPDGQPQYGEIIAVASCLAEAEELVFDASSGLVASDGFDQDIPTLISADRITAAQLGELLSDPHPDRVEVAQQPTIVRARLLEPEPPDLTEPAQE
jgi:hypothetical protein